MADGDDEPNKKYGLLEGTVLDNADPLGIGRVRVTIPGVAEQGTTWALPIGRHSGNKRGSFDVPDVGADVDVLFVQGDPERPKYLPGHWGSPKGARDVPTPIAEAPPEDAPKIRAFEFDRFVFVIDERDGKSLLSMKDKKTGDGLEWDGEKGAITIEATATLNLKATGSVFIDGVDVQIQGRKVLPGDKPL